MLVVGKIENLLFSPHVSGVLLFVFSLVFGDLGDEASVFWSDGCCSIIALLLCAPLILLVSQK